MSYLIKRIDGWQYDVPADIKLHTLLMDCASEISRLLLANETLVALNAEYADRIKALESKGEPVAYRHWCECDMDEAGNPVFDWEYFDKASCPDCEPLYTTPPSVEVLIAEIESIVKCAETATDGDTGDTIYIGEAYPEYEVKAVLDKYRSISNE